MAQTRSFVDFFKRSCSTDRYREIQVMFQKQLRPTFFSKHKSAFNAFSTKSHRQDYSWGQIFANAFCIWNKPMVCNQNHP